MKDISIYFAQIDLDTVYNDQKIGAQIRKFQNDQFPEIEKGSGIALFYVPEFRGSIDQNGSMIRTEHFRESLYELNSGIDWKMPLYDLGNILPGKDLKDTYFAVAQVVGELVKQKIIPVVVGGSQDLTLALYKGYEGLEQLVNLCSVDHQLDLGSPEDEPHSEGFLSHLLLERPCILFNHANIGLQAPFASKSEFDLFEKLYFDACRLGEFNADFRKAEPHLRNSDILSIDVKSIRASELREPEYLSPNGFYADQICQITKYAGISDKLTTLGIFDYFPEKEKGSVSALIGQMIWYFIDGVSQRKGDFPVGSKKDYLRFSVHLDDFKEELVFYKSNKSERWWMEVPYPPQKGIKYERHHIVPCNMEDYERAMKNEIPDLWWKTYQKLG
ncbi:MAG: formimidoylglutamase [Flavobacteriales bacterium]|jgi:formiminoglutamase